MDIQKDASIVQRAYSAITIKLVDNEQRIVEGLATTPAPDRVGDIVEPGGAQYKLPVALLWHHDSRQPIGNVTSARVTPAGIAITAQLARVADPGPLKDRVDEAWQSIKAGLVRGLSIGFRAIEAEPIRGGSGTRFTAWEWLELSAVTIPANAAASIAVIKDADVLVRNPAVNNEFARLFDGQKCTENFSKFFQERIAEYKQQKNRDEFSAFSKNPLLTVFAVQASMSALMAEVNITGAYYSKKIQALEARISELESAPGLKYVGVFNAESGPYRPGEFVTHAGSLWHCWEVTSETPGRSEKWTLAVKRGKDS